MVRATGHVGSPIPQFLFEDSGDAAPGGASSPGFSWGCFAKIRTSLSDNAHEVAPDEGLST
jgi:hypothetical protein